MTQEPAAAQLAVVTGMSGAGRSTALQALEDVGYFCVDNLPPGAFGEVLTACEADGIERVAVGIDVRARTFLEAAIQTLDATRDSHRTTLLFLDATDTVLAGRYSSTRRPHPIWTMAQEAERQRRRGAPTGSMSVAEGIALERSRLISLRARASVIIDTSELSVHQLRRQILDLFAPDVSYLPGMLTRFASFGFKHGAFVGCDLLFDVRFIENPYFVEELQAFSGLDQPVVDYIQSQPDAVEFANRVIDLLAFLIPKYEQEGKSYLTAAFGCTGGRHRSVAIAEWAAREVGSRLSRRIMPVHRDIHLATQGHGLASEPPPRHVSKRR